MSYFATRANTTIHYTVIYTPGSGSVMVTIDSQEALSARLVIPRSGPGTYDLTNYLAFVDKVETRTKEGHMLAGEVGDVFLSLINT